MSSAFEFAEGLPGGIVPAAADLELNRIKIFSALTEIPFSEKAEVTALRKIAELGHQAMGSHACTLVFVNLDEKHVEQVACAGFDPEFEQRMAGKRISMGVPGDGCFVDYELIARGEVVEKYDLERGGQGVANPRTAQRYNLRAVLSYPLWSEKRLLGYFSHFSSKLDSFTAEKKELLQVFGHQAVVTIERFETERTRERSLRILNELSRGLLSLSHGDFLRRISEAARELLSVPTCILWQYVKGEQRLKIVSASADVDPEYRRFELDPNEPNVKGRLETKRVTQVADVTAPDALYTGKEEARKRGWVSILTAPMYVENNFVGILDVYSKQLRHFKRWEKEALGTFANQAALFLHSETRVEELNRIAQEMAESAGEKALFELTLDRALKLAGASRGWISRLNIRTGELSIEAQRGDPMGQALEFGQGITGLALKEERPYRADDVRDEKWKAIYEEFWPDTRSELAVPILIQNVEVRVGREVRRASKPIGVLNLESVEPGAFSSFDEACLLLLAREAALVVEKRETDRKLHELSRVEYEILGQRNWDETIRVVLSGITTALGYDYVNISLVDRELNRIRTEYIAGIPDDRAASFKRMANHSLDSDDIQADIVRRKEPEVPAEADPRFDRKIYEWFGHKDMIRVFVPMMLSPDKRVIGTVEAGHRRGFREQHIYERDVRVLRDFVDFVTVALEQRRKETLHRIMHEFAAPAAAIRSNASFLQRRMNELPDHIVQRKFDDLLLDAEILLLHVSQVERFLGGQPPSSKPQRTIVYRDIIIKTVNELKPMMAGHGFDLAKVKYDVRDIPRMILYVDRIKLNQVVFNLLINSIKYAEDDPAEFSIRILLDETSDRFILKFKDSGIGINKEFEERIFERGFSTPEAKRKFVTGSGLGLAISRAIMRELGGDLILAKIFKPTEFHLLLPKSLREPPE
jgi:GAF domain-containing protein